jgi:DNA mismatch repair protein MutS
MCGVPVERSDDYLHRLIAQGHRVAVCEQMEDPAEAREARQQERGAPRRGAAGDAGHADRRHAARRRRNNYLLAIARARASPAATALRARLDRYFDRRIPRHRMLRANSRRRSRGIEPGEIIVSDALYGDPELAPLLRAAGGDAADPRRVRRRHRRAAAVRLFRGRHHGRPSARCRGWS